MTPLRLPPSADRCRGCPSPPPLSPRFLEEGDCFFSKPSLPFHHSSQAQPRRQPPSEPSVRPPGSLAHRRSFRRSVVPQGLATPPPPPPSARRPYLLSPPLASHWSRPAVLSATLTHPPGAPSEDDDEVQWPSQRETSSFAERACMGEEEEVGGGGVYNVVGHTLAVDKKGSEGLCMC